MVDLAFSIALGVATLLVGGIYAARVSRAGAARFDRVDRAGGSVLLGKGTMQMGYWAMRPIARACIALRIGPDAVSWASLCLGAAAGVVLGFGRYGAGALLSVLSSGCDAIDGMIARETQTASDAGEVLDATVDRYAELFFFGGIAIHERTDPFLLGVVLCASAGAVMVSYSTAKAEALGVTPPRGAMRRQERAVYLVVGAALVPVTTALVDGLGLPSRIGHLPALAALGLVAVVGNASAVLRLRAVAAAVRQRELGQSQLQVAVAQVSARAGRDIFDGEADGRRDRVG
ncbi:MAG: CDP-alcohol phosphatidyltransferase family protein [Myxococcota bacterium]|nr:CDP-alcohol phosphatidyltransferase family protein [Myxococcota bacterium]